jgi:hypothetical protein
MSARATLKLRPLHVASEQDAPLEVTRFKGESDLHFEKRCASIRALGPRWLNHPDYVFQPRHSINPEVWLPARLLFIERVRAAAAESRARNAAHARTVAVRNALGGT